MTFYETNLDTFGDWVRRDFFRIKVAEVVAGSLSTGYLGTHCQGIFNIVEGEPLNGKGCILSDGSPYFSWQRDPDFLPGEHFFIDIYGELDDDGEEILKGPVEGRVSSIWKKYIEQKQRAGEDYATVFASRNNLQP